MPEPVIIEETTELEFPNLTGSQLAAASPASRVRRPEALVQVKTW
jgi:hypothetical protein